MKRSGWGKERYKVYNLKRKRAPGSIIEPSSVLKEIKHLKKSPMLIKSREW